MPQNLTVVQIFIVIFGIIGILYVIRYLISINGTFDTTSNRPHKQLPRQTKPQQNYTLYNFHSPHCGYSLQFNETWNQLADKLKSISNLKFVAVDVTNSENENLAFYYNVANTPTIVFVGPVKNEEYDGKRDINSLIKFLSDRMQ